MFQNGFNWFKIIEIEFELTKNFTNLVDYERNYFEIVEINFKLMYKLEKGQQQKMSISI